MMLPSFANLKLDTVDGGAKRSSDGTEKKPTHQDVRQEFYAQFTGKLGTDAFGTLNPLLTKLNAVIEAEITKKSAEVHGDDLQRTQWREVALTRVLHSNHLIRFEHGVTPFLHNLSEDKKRQVQQFKLLEKEPEPGTINVDAWPDLTFLVSHMTDGTQPDGISRHALIAMKQRLPQGGGYVMYIIDSNGKDAQQAKRVHALLSAAAPSRVEIAPTSPIQANVTRTTLWAGGQALGRDMGWCSLFALGVVYLVTRLDATYEDVLALYDLGSKDGNKEDAAHALIAIRYCAMLLFGVAKEYYRDLNAAKVTRVLEGGADGRGSGSVSPPRSWSSVIFSDDRTQVNSIDFEFFETKYKATMGDDYTLVLGRATKQRLEASSYCVRIEGRFVLDGLSIHLGVEVPDRNMLPRVKAKLLEVLKSLFPDKAGTLDDYLGAQTVSLIPYGGTFSSDYTRHMGAIARCKDILSKRYRIGTTVDFLTPDYALPNKHFAKYGWYPEVAKTVDIDGLTTVKVYKPPPVKKLELQDSTSDDYQFKFSSPTASEAGSLRFVLCKPLEKFPAKLIENVLKPRTAANSPQNAIGRGNILRGEQNSHGHKLTVFLENVPSECIDTLNDKLVSAVINGGVCVCKLQIEGYDIDRKEYKIVQKSAATDLVGVLSQNTKDYVTGFYANHMRSSKNGKKFTYNLRMYIMDALLVSLLTLLKEQRKAPGF